MRIAGDVGGMKMGSGGVGSRQKENACRPSRCRRRAKEIPAGRRKSVATAGGVVLSEQSRQRAVRRGAGRCKAGRRV